MVNSNSTSDELMQNLADLLFLEDQMIMLLPKLAQASRMTALKALMEEHLKVTNEQNKRLKDIFSNTGQIAEGTDSLTLKDIRANIDNIVNVKKKGQDNDIPIISVVQRLKQYEIAAYQTACEHAAYFGHTMIVEMLNKTIDEEKAMNLYLNELSQLIINKQAVNADMTGPMKDQEKDPSFKSREGGFYNPKGRSGKKEVKKRSPKRDVFRFISEGNPNTQEPLD